MSRSRTSISETYRPWIERTEYVRSMTQQRRIGPSDDSSRTWFVAVALFAAFGLIAAACSSDGPDEQVAEEQEERPIPPSSTSTTEPLPEEGFDERKLDDGSFRSLPCSFSLPEDALDACGTLTVPLDWEATTPSSAQEAVTLDVVLLRTESTRESSNPILFIGDGPGTDAISQISRLWNGRWSAIADSNPLLFLAPRGSASSDPTISCQSILDGRDNERAAAFGTNELITSRQDALLACDEELDEQDLSLEHFSTLQAARDIEALRRSLGFDKLALLSVGYGANLAEEYAKLSPEAISAIVLDSPDAAYPGGHAPGSYTAELLAELPAEAIERAFLRCEQDTACASAHTNLDQRFQTIVRRANTDPIDVETFDLDTFEPLTSVLSGDELVELVGRGLRNPNLATELPLLVEQLENGSSSLLSWLVAQDVQQLADWTPGLDPRSLIIEEDVLANDDPPPPTLVLRGSQNPLRPSADEVPDDRAQPYVRSAAQTIEFERLAHTTVSDACARSITVSFINEPKVDLDTDCLAGVGAPPYEVVAAKSPALEPFEIMLGDASPGSKSSERIVGLAPEGWLVRSSDITNPTPLLSTQTTLIPTRIQATGIEAFLDELSAGFSGALFQPGEALTIDDQVWQTFSAAWGELLIVDVYVEDTEEQEEIFVLTTLTAPTVAPMVRSDVAPELLASLERTVESAQ